MIDAKIPYDFIRQHADVGWRDVALGLRRELIAPRTAIQKAVDRLSESDEVSADELELAGRRENEPVLDLVLRLSESEELASDQSAEAKWLYLVLAWLFENRHLLDDALGMVEIAYADFGYPREITSFVRYMPMMGPDLGSREHNEARLYDRWKDFLDAAGKNFTPKT